MTLTSIVLRDERDKPMGYARQSHLSGWLWACALCPAANAPGAGTHSPDTAVRHLAEHLRRGHPAVTDDEPSGLARPGTVAP